MIMKHSLALFLTVVLTLSFATVALAGEGHHGKKGGHGLCPKMIEKLNLTADQQKKAAGLQLAFKKVAAPAKAQIEVKHAELKALWMSEKPNRSNILAKQAEIFAEKKKIKTAKVDLHLGLLKILTKKQKKAMWAMKAEKGKGGCGCGGHGHKHGKGHGHEHGKGKPPCKHGH
jgi:Spy/CpxP family protein refolding chaperone